MLGARMLVVFAAGFHDHDAILYAIDREREPT
jgi:hypothetical protein